MPITLKEQRDAKEKGYVIVEVCTMSQFWALFTFQNLEATKISFSR